MISFVIPARNEERYVGDIIDSVRSNVDGKYRYEIIVVDNGSADSTADIAVGKGARLLRKPGSTIPGLRNAGAAEAKGEILVFLDADVLLKDTWGEKIRAVIESLSDDPRILTGSTYSTSKDATWVERHWHDPDHRKKKVTHLNGGHFIITRGFFLELGGFDAGLETGEEGEFCRRAKRSGAKIVNNLELEVFHRRFPQDVSEFFKKQRWYGHADYKSLKAFISSVPAILSMGQFVLLLLALLLTAILRDVWPVFAWLLVAVTIDTVVTLRKVEKIDGHFLPCLLLFTVYFLARIVAFFDIAALNIGRSLHLHREG